MTHSCKKLDECRDLYPSEKLCPDCQSDLGFPNVRQARKSQKILQERYEQAKFKNITASNKIEEFENAITQYGDVVIALSYKFVEQFLNMDKPLYANYYSLVDAKLRLPAETSNHQRRVEVDNQMFPGYEREISFGVLSLNKTGVWSYGPCHITLGVDMIENRTTFAHQNTYNYQNWCEEVKQSDGHKSWKEQLGYRCEWHDKSKLAVAKLASGIKPKLLREEFANILLHSAGDRSTDEFIEAHIYGSFTSRAINSVRTPSNAEAQIFDRDTNKKDLNFYRGMIKSSVEALSKKRGFQIDYKCGD